MGTQDQVSNAKVCIYFIQSINLMIESPAEYLENNIFPILLPALEEMLRTASITEVSQVDLVN